MYKFFKVVDGKKLYCDEQGALIKQDGAEVEVPETDTEAVDVETVDEATKLLGDAYRKALEAGDEAAQELIKNADTAVAGFFEAIAAQAKKHTPKVEVVKDHTASFDVSKVKAGIEHISGGNKGSVAFKVNTKADLDYLAKDTSRGDLTDDVIVPERDPEITRTPVRSIFMEQIADTVPIDGDFASWVEVTGSSGAPATTAELATIPQKDYTFQEYRQPVEKIAVINKHSVELLKYGPELVAAIRSMLQEDLNIEVDGQLLSGNGTAPNLQGVLGVASVLDATEIGAQEIANPNLFDVLRVAGTKIATAGSGKYIPNYVVLNPVDTERFDLTKNADGDYIMPPFYDATGRRVMGARVIENTAIAADTFLIGDFRHLHVRPKGGVEIELTNTDGTDFQNDLLSIKLRRFMAAYVRNNDNGAFMTGDITDCLTALTPA